MSQDIQPSGPNYPPYTSRAQAVQETNRRYHERLVADVTIRRQELALAAFLRLGLDEQEELLGLNPGVVEENNG